MPNSTEKHQLELRFGALAPHIHEQLEAQGYTIPGTDRYQAHSERITHLLLANILTDGEAKRARGRLFKIVLKEVSKLYNGI